MLRIIASITTEQDGLSVLLAAALCLLASVAAILLLQRAHAHAGTVRNLWTAAAGLVAACGIWTTQFVALQGYDPDVPVGFDPRLMALAFAAAVAASLVACVIVVQWQGRAGAVAGGLAFAAAIAATHFLGLLALETLGETTISLDLVAASLLLGIGCAVAALLVARHNGIVRLLFAGVLLATAILAQHFTAMSAITIVADLRHYTDRVSASPDWIAAIIVGGAIALLGMGLIAALSDRRMQALATHKDELLAAALDNLGRGLCMFDADGRLVLWNKDYLDVYRLPPDVAKAGTTVREILQARIASGSFYEDIDSYERKVRADLAKGRTTTRTYELRDGRTIVVVNEPMPNGGWVSTHEDVTAEKRREASFRLLFESNPLPMYVYDLATLRFLAVNAAAVAHYGYSREQFLAMTLPDMRAPEDREAFIRAIRASGGNYRAEQTWRHRKADGTLFETEVFARELNYGGVAAGFAVVLDVTERKRASDELKQTREFLNTVIDNVPVSITVKNAADFSYALINQAGERFFGRSRKEIIGRTVEEIFPSKVADAVMARDRELLENGKTVTFKERPLRDMPGGDRIINTRKMLVHDDRGKPQYILSVIEDVTERKRAEAKIAHLAHYDALTDLPNRASFTSHLETTLERAAALGERFAVMCLDLDRFQEINDVFGHANGDNLLREMSRRMQAAASTEFLARLGGDEFALIAVTGTRVEAIEALAQRLLAAAAEDFDIGGSKVRIGLSIGVAIYPSDGGDAMALLGNADAALYRAKSEGRGMMRFFDAETDKRLRDRRALHQDMQSVIERNELILHYQPQAVMDGTVTGFEALVRWQHPVRGLIPPATFIPIAEETGLIIPIGEWILRAVCREAASWPRPLQVAINLSPAQFQHGDLPALVHTVLLETGLPAGRLEIEITEGILIGDFSRGVAMLRRLKALGVRIAMDDFGTGYSSLSYLQAFPFDKIKIDRAFIDNVEHNEQSAAIVRAVIGLGHGLGLPVVAEGVETPAQLAMLAGESCDEFQGYLLGRPRPIEDYAELTGSRPSRGKARLALVS